MTTTTTNPTTFVALCPNYWGKGATVDEAKKNLKEAGGNLTKYVVFRLPDGATNVGVSPVNGAIDWEWAEGADTTRTMEVVAKRGVNL